MSTGFSTMEWLALVLTLATPINAKFRRGQQWHGEANREADAAIHRRSDGSLHQWQPWSRRELDRFWMCFEVTADSTYWEIGCQGWRRKDRLQEGLGFPARLGATYWDEKCWMRFGREKKIKSSVSAMLSLRFLRNIKLEKFKSKSLGAPEGEWVEGKLGDNGTGDLGVSTILDNV